MKFVCKATDSFVAFFGVVEPHCWTYRAWYLCNDTVLCHISLIEERVILFKIIPWRRCTKTSAILSFRYLLQWKPTFLGRGFADRRALTERGGNAADKRSLAYQCSSDFMAEFIKARPPLRSLGLSSQMFPLADTGWWHARGGLEFSYRHSSWVRRYNRFRTKC